MNIYEIKRRTSETSPYFFSRQTLKFFHQTMRDFSVHKHGENTYLISAPMRDHSGKQVGTTRRLFNTLTNELENI